MDTETEKMIIVDEDGNEKEYTILFTFYSDEFGKDYVLFYDENDEDGVVDAMAYDEEGYLYEVESMQEWDAIEEIFNAFMSEEDEEETEVDA